MRRRYFFWIASWFAIGLSACTTTINQCPPAARPLNLQPAAVATPLIDTSRACAKWRWIGIKRRPETRCPEVPGWDAAPLFRDYGRQPYGSYNSPLSEVTRELERFCVYQIEDSRDRLGDLTLPPALSAELVRFDQDCAALSTSAASDLEEKTWKPLAEHFLSQVGGMGDQLEADGRRRVRLTFLDTQPDGEGAPIERGRSRHGYTLAHMARHLVCSPEGRCAAQIATRLALPIVRFDPEDPLLTEIDDTHGGFVGTLSHLAQAIENEVYSWKENHPEQRLVLNLSAAWDGELFGGLDERRVTEMRAGTQAVYYALRYAAGHGALVLAAAGNQKYGPSRTTGPLLPAAWERGGLEAESCGKSPTAPLLYAVGGVQSGGYPLANARIGGMPPRVAYADHAVVSSSDPTQPTAIYTGSSVATAVASSIAAVVWDSFPNLDSHAVMKILYDSGDRLAYDADFYFGDASTARGSRLPVHRLSLCAALEEAAWQDCKRTGSSCERTSLCKDWKRERPRLSSLWVNTPPLSTPFPQRFGVLRHPDIPPPCRAEKIFYPESGASLRRSFCPSDQFYGITSQPWLYPQPEDDPCPNCMLTPPPPSAGPMDSAVSSSTSYTLRGVIQNSWSCLVGATLDIEQPALVTAGTVRQRVSFNFPQTLCAGEAFEQVIELDAPIDDQATVTLGFVLEETGNTSVQSPILITQ